MSASIDPAEPPADPVDWAALRRLFMERLRPLTEGAGAPAALLAGYARGPAALPAASLLVLPAPGAVPGDGYYPGRAVLTLRARATPELDALAGRTLPLLLGWRPDENGWRLRGLALASISETDAGLAPDQAGSVKRREMSFEFLALRAPPASPEPDRDIL